MEEDLKKPDQDSLSYKSSKVDVNELFGLAHPPVFLFCGERNFSERSSTQRGQFSNF